MLPPRTSPTAKTPGRLVIHQGVIKIVVDDELFYDFQLNTTESVIVGRDRDEVLEKVQRGFENQYNLDDKLKKEEIKAIDYETKQAWKTAKIYHVLDSQSFE